MQPFSFLGSNVFDSAGISVITRMATTNLMRSVLGILVNGSEGGLNFDILLAL